MLTQCTCGQLHKQQYHRNTYVRTYVCIYLVAYVCIQKPIAVLTLCSSSFDRDSASSILALSTITSVDVRKCEKITRVVRTYVRKHVQYMYSALTLCTGTYLVRTYLCTYTQYIHTVHICTCYAFICTYTCTYVRMYVHMYKRTCVRTSVTHTTKGRLELFSKDS